MKRTILILACAALAVWAGDKKKTPPPPSALDRYIEEAMNSKALAKPESPGSLFRPDSPLTDLARDFRARSVNDLVIIQVVERASAVTSGDLKSDRQSSLKASVTALGGVTRATGPLANLGKADTSTSIAGSASTQRSTSISTSLAARVTHVLPNGFLVLEGTKEVQINSERQVVTIRGIARPVDLSDNTVLSDHLAQLEVRVNGKGVVSDAIRRPFFLYRLLMGILPL